MTSLSGQLPAGGLKEQLATVFTQIKEAQTLDVNGDELVSGVSWPWSHSHNSL